MPSPLLSVLAIAALGILGGCAMKHKFPSPPSGRIDGVVLDEQRHPLARAMVSVVETTARGELTDILPLTNEQGRFGLGRLPAGRYTLKADLAGYEPQTETVTVGEGKRAEVEFVLRVAR